MLVPKVNIDNASDAMWIVYKQSEDGGHIAIQVPKEWTAGQISDFVGLLNWYGSSKLTADDAIAEAIADNFKYRPREEMAALSGYCKNLRQQLTSKHN